MATLADMRSRIADDINTTAYNTQIDLAINRAIKHYAKDDFWFTEATDTFTTVADQKIYTSADSIPTDIAEFITTEVTDTDDSELIFKPFEYLERQYQTSTTGLPHYYHYYDETFYLYPTPDAAYTVKVYYRKLYTDLSADGDTNDFLVHANDLIEARARKWIAARILMDYDMARVAGIEEDEALLSLRQQHTSKKPLVVIPSRF